MKWEKIIFWAVGIGCTLPALAQAGSENAARCQCLSIAPSVYLGVRDGSAAVSAFIPPNFVRTELDSPDSEDISWLNGDSMSLGISSYSSGLGAHPDFDKPERDECVVQINARRVLVGFTSDEKSQRLHARFDDNTHLGRAVSFSVAADDSEKLCNLARPFLWSIAFVNDWRGLQVIAISKDKLSFEYVNEIGEIKAGKIGHLITRDFGQVKSIGENSVSVVELIPNGMGGYDEVERTIRLVVH